VTRGGLDGPAGLAARSQRLGVDHDVGLLVASGPFLGADGDGGCRVATRDVFAAEELARLRSFPEINRADLIRYFTLTGPDEVFLRRYRGARNVMGAAVQLCTLPWLGFVPDDVTAAPAAAVARLSQRLGIPVGELRGYGDREQTRTGPPAGGDRLRGLADDGRAGVEGTGGIPVRPGDGARRAEAAVPAGVRVPGLGAGGAPGRGAPAGALEAANAAVVNYHHRLPLTQAFGTGTLSSSDGQRFPVKGKSITARHLSLCSSKRQQNALATAIKEYGALHRTVYAARYLADEAYQRRIAGRQWHLSHVDPFPLSTIFCAMATNSRARGCAWIRGQARTTGTAGACGSGRYTTRGCGCRVEVEDAEMPIPRPLAMASTHSSTLCTSTTWASEER
jgi:hypothetical protein